MARVFTSEQAPARVERGALPAGRRRPRRRPDLGRLPALACWRSRVVACCSSTCSCGSSTTCRYSLRHADVDPVTGVQHRRLASSPTPTGRRTRARRRMGYVVQMAGLAVQNFVSAAVGIAVAVALDPRLRPQQHRPARQLLGRPDPDRACASCCRSSIVVAIVFVGGRRDRRTSTTTTTIHTLAGGHADHHRRPGRQPGGDQGARHQRRRLLQRQLRAPVREPERAGRTGSRSSCCWSSRSRCPAPSA